MGPVEMFNRDVGLSAKAANDPRPSDAASKSSTSEAKPVISANPRIIIGVWTTSHRQALFESILAIYETAGRAFELVVLDDIQESQARLKYAYNAHIIKVPKPGGGAARLNQLLAFDADLYVMIEAGAIPAPYWLDRMVAALNADPAIGAVGPSTNACWNEQASIECTRPSLTALSSCAAKLRERFGDRTVSMCPTHNLADFAFVVTRPLAEAVGLADEDYLNGPCWEMDYWARAALAGWKTVWAQSAFVWRNADFVAGSRRDAATLNASKQRYRKKFCTVSSQRTQTSVPTCGHCLGSACSAFARAPITHYHSPIYQPTRQVIAKTEDYPLISCIMPTRRRSEFVAQSIRYFQRQDYPNRELVIVYETPSDLPEQFDDKNIKLIRTTEMSIGGKREIGSQGASGDILVHWDDDDWFADNRLSRQAAPILANLCDISGLTGTLFLELTGQTFWDVTPELFETLFFENVLGGALMFRRNVWEMGGPYPKVSLREDVAILIQGLRKGARLARISGRDLCVYLRHGNNSWRFAEGKYLDPGAWSKSSIPPAMQCDIGFYAASEDNAAPRTAHETGRISTTKLSEKLAAVAKPALPKLSCIMPTSNRHQFVPNAIAQFLMQDYQNRELIVLDDGALSVEALVPPHPMIRYYRVDTRQTLGEKRNMACELAEGDVIAHWDDDDWIAPTWLSSQVACLRAANADISGVDQPLFHDPVSGMVWRYVYDGVKPWAAGGTLCYRREFWARNRFASITIGEDNLFLWSPQEKQLAINLRADLYVARVHPGNTSPKRTSGTRWNRVTGAAIREAIDESILNALAIRQPELS